MGLNRLTADWENNIYQLGEVFGRHKIYEAIIDNGSFGERCIRFETGRLARQAAGSAVAYLDEETAVLSATTVSSTPRDQFDFFL